MKEYILYLPVDNWELVIMNDFNTIITKEIFEKSFNPSAFTADEVITDVQHLKRPTLQRDASLNILSVEHIDESAVCQNI